MEYCDRCGICKDFLFLEPSLVTRKAVKLRETHSLKLSHAKGGSRVNQRLQHGQSGQAQCGQCLQWQSRFFQQIGQQQSTQPR